ncbi:MAG: tetratricopeptide repeat protein [Deltaproteobacteria bacterium]|nr:tetratricopeptide repeat protein [Deltaproteobacteria bacterium]
MLQKPKITHPIRQDAHMVNTMKTHPTIQMLIIGLVLTAMTIAVFWQVTGFDFVNFDDRIYVTENLHIQSGISLNGFRWAFTTTYAQFWHPLTWLSLMVDYELFALNAGGYHLTNLLLHIMSTLLLFWLFRRMTGALWPSAFIAAFFALHPLHVESVAWIAERKDVLSGFFWMLTLCLYVYYTEKPTIRRYGLVLLSFTCGLMSKSMVVTLPVILILLDYWPLGRLQTRTIRTGLADGVTDSVNVKPLKTKAGKNTLKKKITPPDDRKSPQSMVAGIIPLWQLWEKIPFFVLSAVFSIITLYAQHKPPEALFPWTARLANASVSFVTYLAKLFWPHHLAVFYPFPDHLSPWQVAGAVLLICVVSTAVIILVKRFPFLLVGWLWYSVTLLPVIGIIQIGDFAMADRYTYLPTIGISVMLAWGVPLLFPRVGLRRNILFPTGIIILAVWAVLSWQQCRYWKNSLDLFQHALQVTKDNRLARNSLGVALTEAGRHQEAIAHYQAAVDLNPYDDKARCNLGLALAADGKIAEAITHYRAALDFNPNNEIAHTNIGSALVRAGKNDEAADHYRTAIQLNPNYDHAHYNFANLLIKQGKMEDALKHYQLTVKINSHHEDALANWADILVRQGKIAEAIEQYRQVLKINPSSFRALNNLGVNLEKQLRHDEAIACYHQALNVEPSNPGVHFNLGVALGNKGDLDGAIEHFRMAVSLQPKFVQAEKMLKTAEQMRREKR